VETKTTIGDSASLAANVEERGLGNGVVLLAAETNDGSLELSELFQVIHPALLLF
jgi:hypothetical protein